MKFKGVRNMIFELFVSCILLASFCDGHMTITYPPARKYALDFLDVLRTPGPCGGMPKGLGVVTDLKANDDIEFTWHLGYPHQGAYRLLLLDDKNKPVHSFTDGFVGKRDPTKLSHRATIPNLTCTNCTIQLKREANEWTTQCNNGVYAFYSCADVNIVQASSLREPCSGHGTLLRGMCHCDKLWVGNTCQHQEECLADSDCLHGGKCEQNVDNNYPKNHCYCAQGWFGRHCEKESSVSRLPRDLFRYTRTLTPGADDYRIYHRILKDEDEIEVVLIVRTNTWIGFGWRPKDLRSGCRLFPALPFYTNTNQGEGTPKPEGEGEPEGTPKPEGEGEPEGTPKPEGEGEPESTPKPEGEGEPEHTPKPEGEGEPESTPKPEGEGEPESTPKPEGEGEPEHTPKPEGEGEPEHTPKPEGEGEPEHTPKPEGEGEPEHTPKPEGEGEPESTPTPEGEGEPEHTPKPEGEGEPESTPKPEGEGEPEHTPNPEGEGEPEHTPKPEGEGEPESTPKPEGEGEPEHTPKPEGEGEPEHTPKSEGEGEPEHTPKPEGEGEPEHTPKPEGEGEPESTPKPEGEGEPEHTPKPEGEGEPEHTPKPEGEGEPESTPKPEGEGEPEGTPKPEGEGEPTYTPKPEGEGEPEGTPKPEGEGEPEGEGDGSPSWCGAKPAGTSPTTGVGVHEMDCSDIVIGTARGSRSRIADYYTRDRSTPQLDSFYGGSESLTAAVGEEIGGWTTILFRRKLTAATSDPADHSITNAAMHVLWARGQVEGNYHHDEPSGLEATGTNLSLPVFYKNDQLKYHGEDKSSFDKYRHRGYFDLNFFDIPEKEDNVIPCDGGWTAPSGVYNATWHVDKASRTVTFTLSARLSATRQEWLAIGFNDKPQMTGPKSDGYIAWVDNQNIVHVSDRRIPNYATPIEDSKQNAVNISGSVQDGVTTVTFSRDLDTGDDDDFKFSNDSCAYILYSWGGAVDASGGFSRHTTERQPSSQIVCFTKCDNNATTVPTGKPLLLVVDITFKLRGITFVKQYLDPTSTKYKELAMDVTRLLEKTFQPLTGYRRTEIIGFRNGSVYVDSAITLERKSSSVTDIKTATKNDVNATLSALISGGGDGGFVFNITDGFQVGDPREYGAGVDIDDVDDDDDNGKVGLIVIVVCSAGFLFLVLLAIAAYCRRHKQTQLLNSDSGSDTMSMPYNEWKNSVEQDFTHLAEPAPYNDRKSGLYNGKVIIPPNGEGSKQKEAMSSNEYVSVGAQQYSNNAYVSHETTDRRPSHNVVHIQYIPENNRM